MGGDGGWGGDVGGTALRCAHHAGPPPLSERHTPHPPQASIREFCAPLHARSVAAASWDPRREGSLLGWTEFQANVPLLMDRFRSGGDDSKN